MPFRRLEIENAHAHYDEEKQIAFIKYIGLLDGETSTQVYSWLADLIEEVGFGTIYGEVFDFRDVMEFLPDNLMEARRKSRRHNLKNPVKQLPVSMIISSHYQEEILRGPMQNVEENKRKAIVWNMDDALAFLDKWHEQHKDKA